VAREVGTEGVLGGQAEVPNVAGTWKDLTDNVNFMAGNLTGPGPQHRAGHHRGGARRPQPEDHGRREGRDAGAEEHHQHHGRPAQLLRLEVTRVASEVGTEGSSAARRRCEGVAGTWRDLTDNVNQLAGNLTVQLRDVSAVATAIADGDLTRKITVEAQGEILQIKDVINSMVDRLGVFADEVTRVAREVGTEGVLGGQAEVPGVAGTWKDLTDSSTSWPAT
jgi:HAMP domain-containing protein